MILIAQVRGLMLLALDYFSSTSVSLEFLFQLSLASSSQYMHLCIFNFRRFPSPVKASKHGKCDLTPAKGPLTSGKLNPPVIDMTDQPQTEVDLV